MLNSLDLPGLPEECGFNARRCRDVAGKDACAPGEKITPALKPALWLCHRMAL
jgi:hypothetical protein